MSFFGYGSFAVDEELVSDNYVDNIDSPSSEVPPLGFDWDGTEGEQSRPVTAASIIAPTEISTHLNAPIPSGHYELCLSPLPKSQLEHSNLVAVMSPPLPAQPVPIAAVTPVVSNGVVAVCRYDYTCLYVS